MILYRTYSSLIVTIFFVLISVWANSQCYFHRLYDANFQHNGAFSAIEPMGGGVIACGVISSTYLASQIVRTDECGDTIWTKEYDFTIPAGSFTSSSIIQLQDSSYVICGDVVDTIEGATDTYLLKLNTNGDTLWYQTIEGGFNDRGIMHKQTPDSGFIIGGYRNVLDSGILIIKTDAFGNIEWLKEYGDSLFDLLYSIDFTKDGGYILAGQFQNIITSSEDLFLIKTDSLGNFEWKQYYGDGLIQNIGYAISTLDSGYAIVGWSDDGTGNAEGWIIKTDSLGNVEWSKMWGMGNFFDRFYVIRQLPDSSYIVGGNTRDYNENPVKPRVWLVKLNPQGDTLWTRSYTYYGGQTDDYLEDISLTDDGGYIMTGYIINNALPQKNDLLLIRTDSLGRVCEYYDANIWMNTDTVYLSGNTTVQFADSSNTCCANWDWNFGIWGSDSVQNPVMTFDTAGVWKVVLTVFNGACSVYDVDTVWVINDVGIEEQSAGNGQLAVYPNPSKGEFVVEIKNSELRTSNFELKIYDVTGRLVKQFIVKDSPVEVSGLEAGMFYVQLLRDGQILATRKMVITR